MKHSLKDTPVAVEDFEISLIRKLLLEIPCIDKQERDRALSNEHYPDNLKSLINFYPIKKSNP